LSRFFFSSSGGLDDDDDKRRQTTAAAAAQRLAKPQHNSSITVMFARVTFFISASCDCLHKNNGSKGKIIVDPVSQYLVAISII
jgi:hypothetical protein